MSRFSPRESEANAPFTQALVSCRAGVASVIRLDIHIFALFSCPQVQFVKMAAICSDCFLDHLSSSFLMHAIFRGTARGPGGDLAQSIGLFFFKRLPHPINVVPEFCSPAVWSVTTAAAIQAGQRMKMSHYQKYIQAGVPLLFS